MVAACVRVVRARGQRVLGREHEALAIRRGEGADELLALSVRVVARRVDEVPAGLDVGVEDAARLVLRRTPAPGLAERHRAERDLRDPEAAVAEQRVAHHSSSVPRDARDERGRLAGCLAPRDIGVCPCVPFECDQARLAQLRRGGGARSSASARSRRPGLRRAPCRDRRARGSRPASDRRAPGRGRRAVPPPSRRARRSTPRAGRTGAARAPAAAPARGGG